MHALEWVVVGAVVIVGGVGWAAVHELRKAGRFVRRGVRRMEGKQPQGGSARKL